ncbi:MAG: nuclear transport factor 2 family protein [Thermoleophilia bacterium]|nr:nuclear transport factor 2 family protein [Thermoleophilia bacterium]
MLEADAVVRRYLEALRAGDLAGVVASFTEDMVMLTPEETIVGRDAFRVACEGMFAGLLAPGTYKRRIEALTVRGDLALLVWSAACLGSRMSSGVTTFVVRGGLISRLTTSYRIEPD